MKNTITKPKAIAAAKKVAKMVGESNYFDYFSVSSGTADNEGWWVNVSFLWEKENKENEHNRFFLCSFSQKEDIDKFYSNLADFLSKF